MRIRIPQASVKRLLAVTAARKKFERDLGVYPAKVLRFVARLFKR